MDAQIDLQGCMECAWMHNRFGMDEQLNKFCINAQNLHRRTTDKQFNVVSTMSDNVFSGLGTS